MSSSSLPTSSYAPALSAAAPAGLPDIPGGVAPWAFQPFAPPSSSLEPKLPGNLIPVPKAITVPVVHPPFAFRIPEKMIQTDLDVKNFVEGPTGRLFQGYLASLCDSIQGKKLSDPCDVSATCQAIISLLDALEKWVDEIPPAKVALRYGNPSYRIWQERLQQQGPRLAFDLIAEAVREQREAQAATDSVANQRVDGGNEAAAAGAASAAVVLDSDAVAGAALETFSYLADSFGNATRIDYGTGHEANFMAWLLCLTRLGLLKPKDNQAVATRVFSR